MPEAIYRYGATRVRDHTPGTALLAGAVVVLPDNRVGVAVTDIAANQVGSVYVDGVFDVLCASGVTAADGAYGHWDVSADTLIFAGMTTGDARMGTILGAKVSGQTVARVDLNAIQGSLTA